MFRIRRIHSPSTPQDELVVAQVVRICQDAFSCYPKYAEKIAAMLRPPSDLDFELLLLVAEGPKGRMLGFTLSFLFPELRLAYLDHIASDPKRTRRGHALRNLRLGATGFFRGLTARD